MHFLAIVFMPLTVLMQAALYRKGPRDSVQLNFQQEPSAD